MCRKKRTHDVTATKIEMATNRKVTPIMSRNKTAAIDFAKFTHRIIANIIISFICMYILMRKMRVRTNMYMCREENEKGNYGCK